MDALADPAALGGVDENDPRSVARFMKRMSQEMGEDLGDDFEAALDEESGGNESETGALPGDGSEGV